MKWYLIDDIEVMPECLPKIKTGILHSHNSLSRQYYDYIQRENGKNPVQQKYLVKLQDIVKLQEHKNTQDKLAWQELANTQYEKLQYVIKVSLSRYKALSTSLMH